MNRLKRYYLIYPCFVNTSMIIVDYCYYQQLFIIIICYYYYGTLLFIYLYYVKFLL